MEVPSAAHSARELSDWIGMPPSIVNAYPAAARLGPRYSD